MSGLLHHQIRNNNFAVSSNRCLFWEEEKMLILSDLHLGKAGHFRKSGIGVPQSVFIEDMQRLLTQVRFFNARTLMIVGDLFHSTANKENDLFVKWISSIPSLDIHLVKGNHDILKASWYTLAAITLHDHAYHIGEFSFVHDINHCSVDTNYCFSGHIHPGVVIHGMGRQSLKLPCFYFGKDHAVLPAFGRFTGSFPVRRKQGDVVFAIAEDSLVKINTMVEAK